MSHFLSRLVQRSFGEVATVRPAPLPVTAPDDGAQSWDERVFTSDTPRLVRRAAVHVSSTPHVSPSLTPPSFFAPALGTPPDAPPSAVLADDVPPALDALATPAPTALTQAPVVRATTHEAVASIAARAIPPAPGAPGPDAAPTTAAAVDPSLRGNVKAAPGGASALPGVALAASPAPDRDDGEVPLRRAALTPRAHVHVAVVEHDGAPAPAPVAAAPVVAPETALRASSNVPPGATPSVAASVRLAPAPPSTRGGPGAPQRAAPHVVEDRTTVEVSIGRIEVRLPARSTTPTAAGAAPSRRPAVGLADYLRARDERGRT